MNVLGQKGVHMHTVHPDRIRPLCPTNRTFVTTIYGIHINQVGKRLISIIFIFKELKSINIKS